MLLFGLGQVEAEATSLLAIIPVVVAGTWRQHLYGNVRWRVALVVGVVAVAGVELGVLTAKSLPEETLQRLFGLLLLTVAAQLVWRARRISSIPVTEQDDLWLRLVDEPIGAIVGEIEAEDPGLRELVSTPEKLLAFRTFANIRVGIVLGRLLMEQEVEAYDGSETWVESLLRNPEHRKLIVAEVHAVAEELSGAEVDEGLGPDDATRDRFRDFARRELGD